ncbi:MAG TPA: response regulator, partial [Methylomirabilota bacterium]|nr:response regulator [Methylomirabilota bacterium]
MSANLLLIESDPTAVDRVRGALAGRGHRLEVAATLDAAVNACAHFEPRLVVLTSELPRVSVADAITQLRGRAGLRSTPFLILMSDYRGTDSREDARRLGAQDILPRSFQAADLVGRVDALLRAASEILTTQAVPQETLDALRRSAGGGRESYSSADLFADILSDVEKESAAPRREERTPRRDVDVDRALADVLGGVAKDKPAPRPSAGSDVDALLSQTLSGLEIKRAASGKTAAA